MANHGKQTRTGMRAQRHYAKPSRQKRHERRYDARVRVMEDFFAARNTAHDRALRIVAYLAKRAERATATKAKAAA